MVLEAAHQIQKFISSRETNITKITKIKLRVRTLEKFRKMTFLHRTFTDHQNSFHGKIKA